MNVSSQPSRRQFVRPSAGASAGWVFSASDAEDVVQEVLIAIHSKRHTWDEARPFLPWVGAVVRYKALDAVRRLARERRRHVDTPVEDWADLLPELGQDPDRVSIDAERALQPFHAVRLGWCGPSPLKESVQARRPCALVSRRSGPRCLASRPA